MAMMSDHTKSRQSGRAKATVATGLVLVAVGTEALLAYNSCIADPACLPSIGKLNVGGFFTMLVAGILVTAGGWWAGAHEAVAGARNVPAGYER